MQTYDLMSNKCYLELLVCIMTGNSNLNFKLKHKGVLKIELNLHSFSTCILSDTVYLTDLNFVYSTHTSVPTDTKSVYI
jgi:hypothetical protein